MKSMTIEIVLQGSPSVNINAEGDGELSEIFPWNVLTAWWQAQSVKTCVLTLGDGSSIMLDRDKIVVIKMVPTPPPLTIEGPSDGI